MKHTIVFLSFLSVLNCNSDDTGGFKIQINSTTSSISLESEISIDIKSTNNEVIDSINYFLNDTKINNKILLINNKAGENIAKVDIYSKGKKYSINKRFDVYSNTKPELMTYKIIKKFNHDKQAYTQGLEFYNNYLDLYN